MSQYDFGTIDPDEVGGTELAVMLNEHRDAMHSGHKGAARPSYAVAGMCWVDDSGTPWLLKRYDGSVDVIEAEFNATDDVVSYRHRRPVVTRTADYGVVGADFGRIIRVDASAGSRTITLPLISTVKDGFPVTLVRADASANTVTVQRAGADTIGGAATTSVVLNGRDQAVELFAAAATGNWALIATAAPDLDTPVVTGLMTVAGVKPATGFLSGTLTMAAHSGGVFMTSGNIVCPNEIGFNATLIAGGAHSVRVATGPTRNLAAGDMFTLAIPAAGVVRAVHTLAANVITMAVS